MNQVTKAVIAAAGRGTRFLPVVKGYPKELIAILDKPNLQYLVEELIGAGIKKIAIVHRHGDLSLKRYFTPDPSLEKYLKDTGKTVYLDSLKAIWQKTELKFIPQGQSLPYGNASPALAAKSFIGSDPFVFMFGDDLAVETKPGTYLKSLINTFLQKKVDMVVAIQQVPWSEIERYGPVSFDSKDKTRLRGVFEKVPRDQAPSNFTQWGRFVTSAQIIKNISKQATSKGELWWADAVDYLAKNNHVIGVTSPKNLWMTTGDPLRWLKVNLTLALRHPDYQKDVKDFLKTLK